MAMLTFWGMALGDCGSEEIDGLRVVALSREDPSYVVRHYGESDPQASAMGAGGLCRVLRGIGS